MSTSCCQLLQWWHDLLFCFVLAKHEPSWRNRLRLFRYSHCIMDKQCMCITETMGKHTRGFSVSLFATAMKCSVLFLDTSPCLRSWYGIYVFPARREIEKLLFRFLFRPGWVCKYKTVFVLIAVGSTFLKSPSSTFPNRHYLAENE